MAERDDLMPFGPVPHPVAAAEPESTPEPASQVARDRRTEGADRRRHSSGDAELVRRPAT